MSPFETPTPKCDAALARLAEPSGIADERLVDALDALRANAMPAVLEWTRDMATSAAHYAKHGGSQADVAGFEALCELARVVAESGQ